MASKCSPTFHPLAQRSRADCGDDDVDIDAFVFDQAPMALGPSRLEATLASDELATAAASETASTDCAPIKRDISFKGQSDLFDLGAPADAQERTAQRGRQTSNITEVTAGSTQVSDNMATPPTEKGIRSHPGADASDRSNSKSCGTRSRGISGISGDLHTARTADMSPVSCSREADQRYFADKVRKVTFQHTAQRTAEAGEPLDFKLDQQKVANRRSHSFQREPRSPSWNNANFDSSAESDNTANERANTSMSDMEQPQLAKLASQPEPQQLPCFQQAAAPE